MNRVILIGRLARDPELRYSQDGKAVCSFTLAVDRTFSQEKEADFIKCTAFGKTAEVAAKYLEKGRQAGVEGRLQIRSYEDKDKIRRKDAQIICDRIEFLGSPKEKAEADPYDDAAIGTAVTFEQGDLPF